MPLIVPNAGELVLLRWLLKEVSLSSMNQTLRLFSNNVTIDKNTVVAGLTEATFTGYVPIPLARGSWVSPVTVADRAVTTYTSTSSVFTATVGTSNTIYGYYVTDDVTGTCLWAENFPAPLSMIAGATLTILPTFTLDSEF